MTFPVIGLPLNDDIIFKNSKYHGFSFPIHLLHEDDSKFEIFLIVGTVIDNNDNK